MFGNAAVLQIRFRLYRKYERRFTRCDTSKSSLSDKVNRGLLGFLLHRSPAFRGS